MSKESWFSAKVRYIVMTEKSDSNQYYLDSLIIFMSDNFQNAFERILVLAKKGEKSYSNAQGQPVVWRLKEIRTLDVIQPSCIDGVEVYCESVDLPINEKYEFGDTFSPEKSHPCQTI